MVESLCKAFMDFDNDKIGQISTWILHRCPSASRLIDKELSAYEKHKPISGWLIPFEFDTRIFNLHIILPGDFPWERPRVYCRKNFKFLEFPHVEKDGAFCLYPVGTEHDPLNFVGLVWDSIREATQLIERSVNPDFTNDFINEFGSYWSKSEIGKNIVSILSPSRELREIVLLRSKDNYFLGGNKEQLEKWLKNYSPTLAIQSLKFETATHICLDRPLKPIEFPTTGQNVLQVVRTLAPDSLEHIAKATESRLGRFLLSFQGQTENGPVLFAVDVLPPKSHGAPKGRSPDMLQKGFRPGKIPSKVRLQRLLGNNSIVRHKVDRADAAWIHGRDSDESIPLLEKRVLLIGCGSLGSEVAQYLAKSGVGNVILVDPELLEYANVGRHVLGVSDVGGSKAESLEKLLRHNYPHIKSIEAIRQTWQKFYEEKPVAFHNVDLIISTVGSWTTEIRLNTKALLDPEMAPLLFGWTEPFSVAGHSVFLGSDNRCLACGLNQTGQPDLHVCAWDQQTTRQEPQCGVNFQPYGPLALAGVASEIAKASIKALLDSVPAGTHTIYLAPEQEVLETGGYHSEVFKLEFGENLKQGGTFAREWPKRANCPFCGGA